MKIKSLINFIKSPNKFIRQKAKKEVDRKLRQMGFIPINEFNPDIDVFIVAFPKSGITWLQSLVAGLQYGIYTEYLPDKLVQEIIPDIYDRPYYKRFGDFKIFKSHELPNPDYKKVIYIIRDGRDAMVSYFHFNRNLNIEVSLEEMIKEAKQVYPVPWWEHVEMWTKNPYNSQILYIKYEDLLVDTVSILKRICNFLGLKRDDSLLHKIAEGSTFEKMRLKAEKYGGLGHSKWQGEKAKQFFRKGKIGAYKEEMSQDLIDYFNQKAEKQLKYWNYKI